MTKQTQTEGAGARSHTTAKGDSSTPPPRWETLKRK